MTISIIKCETGRWGGSGSSGTVPHLEGRSRWISEFKASLFFQASSRVVNTVRSCLKTKASWTVVAHTFNPSTRVAEVGKSEF